MADAQNAVSKNRNASNGARQAGAVLALLAAAAGLFYAMVEPMNQRIDFLQQEVENLRTTDALSSERHGQSMGDRAMMHEKFKEIETQFKWFSDVSNLRANYQQRIVGVLWDKIMEVPLAGMDYWPMGREGE